MKIEEAFFGIMRPNFNHNSELEPDNLFNSMRVLRSVALYRSKPQLCSTDSDPLFFCFGETSGRAEYEWVVSPFIPVPGPATEKKVDVYNMYVRPNKKYLMDLVHSISVNSCKEWLKKYDRK